MDMIYKHENWLFSTGTVTLTSRLSSKSIDEGQNETLTCSATGCPVPNIRWTKDGANLTQTGSTLTLLSVTKNDTGKYACHASNGKDSKSAEMTLTVNCEYNYFYDYWYHEDLLLG